MTTISNGTRVRQDHNTFANVLTSVPANVQVEGDELWVAPADGVEVKKGDKWLHITVGNITGWMAYVHKGVPICNNFVEVGVEPPPPAPTETFPKSFTLTAEDGSQALYEFVKVL